MKKSFLFTIVLTLICASTSFAQKDFEGSVTYSIEYDDLPEEMEMMKSMLPTETIIKIKGSKTRTEQATGMGTTISIYDGKSNEAISLMDMMGRKVAIKTNTKESKTDEPKEKDPKITYLKETKEIAGYQCKKAEILIEGEDESVTIYYTEEINTQSTKSQYKGLKGFPMQYEINAQGLSMTMTVKEVKKGKISSAEFTIPDDYEIMTMEEFQQSMSGQMGE